MFPLITHASTPLRVDDHEPAGVSAQRVGDAGPATGRRRWGRVGNGWCRKWWARHVGCTRWLLLLKVMPWSHGMLNQGLRGHVRQAAGTSACSCRRPAPADALVRANVLPYPATHPTDLHREVSF